ncbi:unnamed protein product [Heterobilharzia americana]|nr:unnamed protein product [Heterobilharzia americana]
MAESCSNVVHLNDINLMAFKSILRYIYTGQIKLSKTKLTLAILGLAHQYNFHSLENALSTYLVHSLCLKNVWSIYDLAIMYDLDDLVAACLRFLDCLAPAPLSDPRFLRLSQTSVERLLSRDSFCASEIEIFRAVCAWLKSSKEVESETKKPHLMSTPESNIDDKLRGESSSENKEGSVSLFIQPKKSSSFEDFDSEKQSLAVDGTDESRAHQMMRKCVRFELMSLTQLLTEVRSSKLVTSEELLDAINQQTNCPTEMPHRGWFFPGINLASRRFGCTLVSGASGTYPYFFVENPLEESNNAKLNIESLISSEPSFCDSGGMKIGRMLTALVVVKKMILTRNTVKFTADINN